MRPRTDASWVAAVLLFALLIAAAPAHADFGIESFTAEVRKADNTTLETQAGAHPFVGVTSFTFKSTPSGPDGHVKDIRVDLPPGLISNPQATPRCTAAQFPSCPKETQVGTEQLTAGVGPVPVTYTAAVYNMEVGPDGLADFGFAVPVLAPRTDIIGGLRDRGDLGLFFTISDIPQSSNLISSTLTFWGVPADPAHDGERGGPSTAPPTPFLTLPTACAGVQTTTLSADSHEAPGQYVTKSAVTPTGATGCDALAFSPVLTATADGRTSAANGAGLTVTITQPLEQSNVRSVSVQLPKELTARGTTVAGACPEATFAADPSGCAAAQVGTVIATTPVLPDALSGPVYLVAHATGLPTIEALLQGHKLSIDLSGTITFTPTGLNSTFATVPDAPITSFVLSLPPGPHSALSSTSGVCGGPLTMPTTIVGQSGARIEQATPIVVTDCAASTPSGKLKILRARVKGAIATLVVQVPRRGTLIATGKGLRRASRTVTKAGKFTLKVRLSKYGRALRTRRHRAHRKLKLPVKLHLGSLKASRSLTFK
jgi:hypothetical protein